MNKKFFKDIEAYEKAISDTNCTLIYSKDEKNSIFDRTLYNVYSSNNKFFSIKPSYPLILVAFAPTPTDAKRGIFTKCVEIDSVNELLIVINDVESIDVPTDTIEKRDVVLNSIAKYLLSKGFKKHIVFNNEVFLYEEMFIMNHQTASNDLFYGIHHVNHDPQKGFIDAYIPLLCLDENTIIQLFEEKIQKYFYVYMNNIKRKTDINEARNIEKLIGKHDRYTILQFETYIKQQFSARKVSVEQANVLNADLFTLNYSRKYPEDNCYIHVADWKNAIEPEGVTVFSDGAHMHTEHFHKLYVISKVTLYQYGFADYAVKDEYLTLISSSLDGKYLSDIQVYSGEQQYDLVKFLREKFLSMN